MLPDSYEAELNKLPESVDGFPRRFAAINGEFFIQYTVDGMYGLFGRPSDVLIMAQGRDLSELIKRVQAILKFRQALEHTNRDDETEIYIDPHLEDDGISNIGIIRPAGMITMNVPCVQMPQSFIHIFFLVKTKGYLLAFGRRSDHYFFQRNRAVVKLHFHPESSATDNMAVAITWSLEDISITGLARPEFSSPNTLKAQRFTERKTDPTVPPNSLYAWARKQLLLPATKYERAGQVFNIIIDSLNKLSDEINITDDIAGFWDEQRNGNKTVKRIPKREPTITGHVESRLRDITLQKNIDIAREIQLGNSKLDLLFSAPLQSGETTKICVELKKAHANDLVHGLVKQLPEYMRRVGTDFGIYCVLYFGDDYKVNLGQFEQYVSKKTIETVSQNNVDVLLGITLSRLAHQNIRIVILNVSPKPSARNL